MRYALRNRDKIKAEYDQGILDRIDQSLDKVFKAGKELDIHQYEGDKFQTLYVDDVGHTVNIIAFYILGITYNVHRLAFKEFIG